MFGFGRKGGKGPVVQTAVVGSREHGKSTVARALSELLPYEYRQPPQPAGQFSTGRGPYQLYDCLDPADFQSRLAVGADQLGGVLLVVAGDEGPMPETREYLEAASAAGVTEVAVFLNKLDVLNDPDVEIVIELEIRELLEELGFQGAELPIVQGSALQALHNADSRKGRRDVLRLADEMDRLFR
ncbi:GTP-binding protein [Streptomyces sp. Da 82-17]|uniref:GTP-binding protein n=1 Tax=Streptomyces sp. Da 82-17 TaxID=3377116 RepID=UPI0038D503D9